MAASLEGATRGSSTYKFEGDEIENLAVSPQLVRWEELDEAHVEDLAWKIAKEKQIQPVIVRKAANGKPELVAGRHRRAAILRINEDLQKYGQSAPLPLKAVFIEMDDEDAIRASFQENTGKPPTVMDLAKAAANFSRLEWDNQKIASTLSTPWQRVSAARVSQLKSYIRLPYKVQSMLHRGILPESAARAMLTMGLDAESMEELAWQVERGEMKPGEIIAESKKSQRAKGKKARRSIADVRELLERLRTDRANRFLDWLDGTLKEDTSIEQIFADNPSDSDSSCSYFYSSDRPEVGR